MRSRANIKKQRFDYRKYLVVLCLLLVVINLLVFFLYQRSHTDQTLEIQVWNYLASGIFKLITVSLIFPIIIILIEGQFKIIEGIRQKREEEIEAKKAEQKKIRVEVVEKISMEWHNLYEKINKLTYYSVINEHEKIKLSDQVTIEINNSISSWEQVFNMCYFHFRNLRQYESSFLYLLNILMNATFSASFLMKHEQDIEKINRIQSGMGQIADGIKNVWHQSFVSLLKLSIDYMEAEENKVDAVTLEGLQKEIDEKLRVLTNWAAFICEVELKNNPVFSGLASAEVEEFRKKSTEMEKWIRENLENNPMSQSPLYPEYKEAYEAIPEEERITYILHPYSFEYFLQLADLFGLEMICNNTIDRATSFGIVEFKK